MDKLLKMGHRIFFLKKIFWWKWGLNSGLPDCNAGTLPLDPHFPTTAYSLNNFIL
jgi:hypothetical protein